MTSFVSPVLATRVHSFCISHDPVAVVDSIVFKVVQTESHLFSLNGQTQMVLHRLSVETEQMTLIHCSLSLCNKQYANIVK